MAEAGVDLKSVLEQDRLLIDELLAVSHKLVIEVKAAYYWTKFSLETYNQLQNIGNNLEHLLKVCRPHFAAGSKLFQQEEGLKLWKTAFGLLRALPTIRNKFTEQLARRRRQRIMGEEFEESAEVDPELIQSEFKRFEEEHAALSRQYAALASLIEQIPAGLVPPEEPTAAEAEATAGGPPQSAPAVAGESPKPEPAGPEHDSKPADKEQPTHQALESDEISPF